MKEIKRRKLWGKIAEQYGTQTAFADALGVSKQSVNTVLTGRKLSQNKIERWSQVLGISREEIGEYFF